VVDRLEFFDRSGKRVPITVSIDLSGFPADSGEPNKLVSLADVAMMEAKRRGGNGYQSADLSSTETFGAQNSTSDVLEGLVRFVDQKDHYTKKPSEAVTRVSPAIADGLGLHENDKNTVRIDGLLHDVGKIGLPNWILAEPLA
jgi:HD-GYP domain-containing protein (c-di-GMP phosphodiesterase class II)